MTHVFVVQVWLDGTRTPVAAFGTRDRAERCVKHELSARLEDMGIQRVHCDYFTVDQWTLGGFLGPERCATLASYTRDGVLDRVMVLSGYEGEALDIPAKLRGVYDDDLFAEEE